MKLLTAAIAAAAIAAGPAAAQMVTYSNVESQWRVPSVCLSSHRFASDQSWTDGVCNRVELSTHAGTNNIRFMRGEMAFTYISSTAAPNVVYAVAVNGPAGPAVSLASGTCEITPKSNLSCKAVTEHNALRITHVAGFLHNSAPEFMALLR